MANAKFVKTAAAVALGASVVTTAVAPGAASAATTYKIKDGKLYKNGKIAKGYVVYKGKLYKNGKLNKGYAKVGTGSKMKLYYNSSLKKGFKTANNKTLLFKDGSLFPGFKQAGADERLYENGKLAAGWEVYTDAEGVKFLYNKGYLYKNLKTATRGGVTNLFENGVLAEGTKLFKDTLYTDGVVDTKAQLFEDTLFVNGKKSVGQEFFSDLLYVDGKLPTEVTKADKDSKYYGTDGKLFTGEATVNGEKVEIKDGEIVEDLSIKTIEALSASQIKINFTKAVDKNTIADADFTVTSLDNSAVTFKGELAEDGKSYTLEAVTGKFDGRYDVKVAADSIKSADGKNIQAYSTTISVSDKTAAAIATVTPDVSGTKATIKFTEQLSKLGTVSVNGVATSVTLADDKKSAEITGLESGKEYKIDVVGAVDLAGNVSNPLTASVSTGKDEVAPSGTVAVKDTTLTLTFSEELKAAPTVTVGGEKIKAVKDATDPKVYTVDATTVLSKDNSAFKNDVPVLVSGITDLAGNTAKNIETKVNLTKDATAPTAEVVSFKKVAATGKLVVKFSEAISAVDASKLSLQVKTAEGVLVTLAPADYKIAATKGYDANQNGTVETGAEKDRYAEITLTDVKGKFSKDSQLVDGAYTFTFAEAAFTDKGAVKNKEAKFTVEPKADSEATGAKVTYTATASTTDNNQFTVVYTEDMTASALDAKNYTIAGQALPAGTDLTFLNNKKTVLVTLPAGSIDVDGARVVIAKDVTSTKGNTISKDQTTQTVDFKETVAPKLDKVTVNSDTQATATFSEKLADNASIKGVKAFANGVELAGATFALTDGAVVITSSTNKIPAGATVTLKFEDTNLADANGNKVANN